MNLSIIYSLDIVQLFEFYQRKIGLKSVFSSYESPLIVT